MLCSPSMPKTLTQMPKFLIKKKKKLMKFYSRPGRHGTFWDILLVDPYIRSIKKLLQEKNSQSIIVFKYFDTFLNAGCLKVKYMIRRNT